MIQIKKIWPFKTILPSQKKSENHRIDNANVPPVFPGFNLADLPDVPDNDHESDENENHGGQDISGLIANHRQYFWN